MHVVAWAAVLVVLVGQKIKIEADHKLELRCTLSLPGRYKDSRESMSRFYVLPLHITVHTIACCMTVPIFQTNRLVFLSMDQK